MTRYRIIYGTRTGEMVGCWNSWPTMLVLLRRARDYGHTDVLRVEDDRACR